MTRLLRLLSKVCTRTAQWVPLAVTMGWTRPLASWQVWDPGQFAAALMARRRNRTVRGVVAAMVRREQGRAAATDLTLAMFAWRLGELRLAGLLARRCARRWPDGPERATAEREARFAQAALGHSLQADVAAAVDGAALPAGGGPLLLTVAGSGYLDLFGLWREHAERFIRRPIVVLALDRVVLDELRAVAGVHLVDLTAWFGTDAAGRLEPFSRRRLWALRVLLLRELARRGHDVLAMDLDAVAVGDVPAMLAALPEADIVAQRDVSLPMEVARQLGFVLCCGFLRLRPTAATQAFLDRYAERTLLDLDDQIAINHLIAGYGDDARAGDALTGRSEADGVLRFTACGVGWVCPPAAMVSRSLQEGSVVRHFHQQGHSVAELREILGRDSAR